MSDHNRRLAFLNEMGLGPVWSQRTTAPLKQVDIPVIDEGAVSMPFVQELHVAEASSSWADVAAIAPTRSKAVNPVADITQMNLEELKSVVSTCTLCDLCRNRTQTVFGAGDQKAKWLFVGDAPGRNEDFQGQPFVGPTGKLLDNMFAAMEIKRGEHSYVANVVKCRPIDNNKVDRSPTLEEINACLPYLEQQIALIKPTVIVALGKTAALSLLRLDPATPLSKLRSSVHRYADLPVIVTYHPAYLLSSPSEKGKAWADLCLAMQTYADTADA